MKKRETKNKKQTREEIQKQKEKQDKEIKTEGFPKDVDFKKFLGCGG